MKKQAEYIKSINKEKAREEMILPFLLVFVFFAGIVLLANYILIWRLQWIGAVFAFIGIIVLASLLYFYRDPERVPPAGKNDILCPADGKIVGVEKVTGAPGLKGSFIRISIFLNVHNVHIQRMPFAAKILDIKTVPGRLLPAFHSEAGEKNRQNIYIIKGELTAVVKQIAGVLVHRPVAWVEAGDTLSAGDRFGMITFGSRVELFVPATCNITALEDDIVYAGTSILGKICKEKEKPNRPSKRSQKPK
ncbi:MAG: phosphatidylserine decarboxylase [Candidatus Firestonebacteria bacterium]|nr:phosphatidylserine decarboxylase [Candidatus Firestonebacteria bacterium]